MLYCISLVFALWLNKDTCCASACIYICSDHVYFAFLSKRERDETSSEFSFWLDYASDFYSDLSVGSLA